MALCKFLNMGNGICSLLNNKCPFVYFCSKKGQWKPINNFPAKCKLINQYENSVLAKDNFYKICFEKRGKLYINYKDTIIIVKNPFDFTPSYVKIYKDGDEIKIVDYY